MKYLIDDELLVAYLEGNLDEKQSEYVEEAIENDPELLNFVEEWVAINDDVCISLLDKTEQFPATGKIVKVAAKKQIWKPLLAAALLLTLLSVLTTVLLKKPDISSPSFGSSPDGKVWTPKDSLESDSSIIIHSIELQNK